MRRSPASYVYTPCPTPTRARRQIGQSVCCGYWPYLHLYLIKRCATYVHVRPAHVYIPTTAPTRIIAILCTSVPVCLQRWNSDKYVRARHPLELIGARPQAMPMQPRHPFVCACRCVHYVNQSVCEPVYIFVWLKHWSIRILCCTVGIKQVRVCVFVFIALRLTFCLVPWLLMPIICLRHLSQTWQV